MVTLEILFISNLAIVVGFSTVVVAVYALLHGQVIAVREQYEREFSRMKSEHAAEMSVLKDTVNDLVAALGSRVGTIVGGDMVTNNLKNP